MKDFWPILVAILLALTLLPGNKPVPVDPVPPPDPVVPIPGPVDPVVTGLRVILAYQTEGKMTAGQGNVLHSAKLSQWLDEHCTDGKQGWRRWDVDVDVSQESELWQALWAEARPKIKELPAIVIVNGTDGPARPLPDKLDEAIKLLEGK